MAKKRRPKAPKTRIPVPPPPSKEEQERKDGLPDVIEVHCPVCQTHWANAAVKFGEPITKGDFTPRSDFSGRVKFQKNGLPHCPVCGFRYDDRCMYALLIAATNKDAMERKLWDRK